MGGVGEEARQDLDLDRTHWLTQTRRGRCAVDQVLFRATAEKDERIGVFRIMGGAECSPKGNTTIGRRSLDDDVIRGEKVECD